MHISLEVSFSSTRGAGGFSISPRIGFRAIVPANSEIFLVLFRAEKSLKTRDVSGIINDTQNALFGKILGGEGSISDALDNGNTILHVRFAWYISSFPGSNNNLMKKGGSKSLNLH